MKHKLIKFFLVLFCLFLMLFNLVNKVGVVTSNGINQSTYLYQLSLRTVPALTCQTTGMVSSEERPKIEEIRVYSSFNNEVFGIKSHKFTSCRDLISANNVLGVVKIQKLDIDNANINTQNHLSDLFLKVIISLALSSVVILIFLLIVFVVKLNYFIYRNFNKKYDILIFAQLVFAFGLFSLLYGQDTNWDLKNYHYYNGWAFLNNRIYIDITPNNGLHGYFSPMLDVLQYLAIHYLPAMLFAFFAGCISGCSAFICYKLNSVIFTNIEDKKFRNTLILYSTVLSITGVANLMQVGAVTNENVIGLLLILAIYLLMKFYKNYNIYVLYVAGGLIGVALGFKLTAVIIAIPICVLFIIFNFKSYKFVILFLVSIIGSFLIIDGLWMYKMYQMFGNPIYPNFGKYINPITALDFQRDTTFIPKDISHWILLPFYLFVPNKLTGEITISDIHFGLTIIAIILTLCLPQYQKIRKNRNIQYIILLFLFSYACWILLFSIQRYTIVLEYLTGSIIFIPFLIYDKITNRIKLVINTLLLVVFLTTHFSSLGHISYGSKFYSSNLVIHNALVIFNDNPTAYIAPELGVTNIYMNAPDFQFTSKFDHSRKVKLLENTLDTDKSIFLVVDNPLNNVEWISAYGLFLNNENCQLFNQKSNLYVCKLIKR